MATLPPWLNVTPELYSRAREAGSNLGMNIAQNQFRAQQAALEMGRSMAELAVRQQNAQAQRAEAAAEMEQRQWEVEQNIAAKATAQAAEREAAAAALEETVRWHTLQSDEDRARLAAQAKHWQALETKETPNRVVELPGGELVEILKDGTYRQIKPPSPAGGTLSPTASLNALMGMGGLTGAISKKLGPEGEAALAANVWRGLTNAPSDGTMTIGGPGAPPGVDASKVQKLRDQANAAIAAGKDPGAVSKRFTELTGQKF